MKCRLLGLEGAHWHLTNAFLIAPVFYEMKGTETTLPSGSVGRKTAAEYVAVLRSSASAPGQPFREPQLLRE